ncbi:MAG: flagellar biosynthesis anti-sigma factor FlgM [Bdellovibrionales bacterium]
MKVNKSQVGSTAQHKVESTKAGKTEASKALGDGLRAGALTNKAALKDSAAVNVSERAQMMQKAKDIASATTVDEAKVARLQKMIDEGRYSVDAKDIADRLVDEHLVIPD